MLRIENITKRFGGLVAVSAVSFEVPQRKIIALVGPNGAGKTTLFNVISGIYPCDEGHVFFDGADVTGWEAYRMTALGLGRTFQNVRLFSHLNALENVMVGRTCRTHSGVFESLFWLRRDRQLRLKPRQRQ